MRQLRALTARQQRIVVDGVDTHLTYDPMRHTKNKKQLRPNALAPWEVRLEDLRVFYDPQDAPDPVVFILAIGRKVGNRVWVEGRWDQIGG